ncbi:rap guanine nucleotide exchange factor 4-like [Lineus longissimus]|uniref:rap guanine nucleotide exchange factor 4-like n=1 Tax=Lineus longissimus TaxID=88925 RepID=UPI002B4E721A
MVSNDWRGRLDKRPPDRSGDDVEVIYSKLKNIKAFEKFHPSLLHQLCYYGYYEDLEKGVTLFRQGDLGTNWYTILSGAVSVHVSETGNVEDAYTLCTLGIGTSFGESILNNTPRNATVITQDYCELLRIERRDFKVLWERYKQLMEGVVTPLPTLQKSDAAKKATQNSTMPKSTSSPSKLPPGGKTQTGKNESPFNPAAPITPIPSGKLARASHVIRTILLTKYPNMIRDRKFHLRTYRRCMIGTEMVDWMLTFQNVHSRQQAVGMWQALLEEGVVVHVCHEHQFMDKYLFYRFHDDDEGIGTLPTNADKKECDDELQYTLSMLGQIGPDAMLRMILRKAPNDRTLEDLELIYDELLHIKALSHLSTMVKRELANVIMFESHAKADTVLFNQGDEGKSWYIILKGSVNVVIYGRGVVCTLHEGDDFGKLALVNDAPRAATIVLREDNCHFLRVDKDDFNRILRDVEANTVRLKEHGQDVLVLEKIPMNKKISDGSIQSHYKYSVMAGTPDKMLEYLLETRIENKSEETSDNFLEDFLLTHVIFMPYNHLCPALMSHYHAEATAQGPTSDSADFSLANKRRIIQFVKEWYRVIGEAAFMSERTIQAFLEELHSAVLDDMKLHPPFSEEASNLVRIMQQKTRDPSCSPKKVVTKGSLRLRGSKDNVSEEERLNFRQSVKLSDEDIFKVFCANHTYTTLKLRMDASVEQIIQQAAEKIGLPDDNLVLCEVKSNGERIEFKGNDLAVTSGLSLNGQLFISPREHIDALTPLPEQDGPAAVMGPSVEEMSTKEVAYHLLLYDWELFRCLHEYELIYLVFGRHKFKKITTNLDVFLRRFNEVQYWVVTEMCLTSTVAKRVQLLRKFIKLAAYCKEYQNLNSFYAIVMGLSNTAVSRLSQTWERLPGKFKKLFSDFETMMDPSRNHRAYRLMVAKMEPSIIPFMPLLMKDMTFTHEGNKSYFDGLINFEKMHMIAQTLRTIRYCRSTPLRIDAPTSVKNMQEVKNYVRNFHVIDNQRVFTQLSHKLEPRRS